MSSSKPTTCLNQSKIPKKTLLNICLNKGLSQSKCHQIKRLNRLCNKDPSNGIIGTYRSASTKPYCHKTRKRYSSTPSHFMEYNTEKSGKFHQIRSMNDYISSLSHLSDFVESNFKERCFEKKNVHTTPRTSQANNILDNIECIRNKHQQNSPRRMEVTPIKSKVHDFKTPGAPSAKRFRKIDLPLPHLVRKFTF